MSVYSFYGLLLFPVLVSCVMFGFVITEPFVKCLFLELLLLRDICCPFNPTQDTVIKPYLSAQEYKQA